MGDSAAITSTVKSWLYQDMLEKPQEMVTYREVGLGGLGVHCVKMKAMAMLIHTFLQQAISPRFTHNQYHEYLFRWHVLEERDFSCPGMPPFYSNTFFSIIKDVKENTPLNLAWVTVKQWYTLLMERGVTHTSDDHDAPPVLLTTRLEEDHPTMNLSLAYRLSQIFGLSPEQKTFNFKLMQSILPTRDRLSRIGKIASSSCLYCEGISDSTAHLLSCTLSAEVSTPLWTCLRSYFPDVSPIDIVHFNIPVSESLELPISWLVSTCMNFIWDQRVQGEEARFVTCRAELLAKVRLLTDIKWRHYMLHSSAVLLQREVKMNVEG